MEIKTWRLAVGRPCRYFYRLRHRVWSAAEMFKLKVQKRAFYTRRFCRLGQLRVNPLRGECYWSSLTGWRQSSRRKRSELSPASSAWNMCFALRPQLSERINGTSISPGLHTSRLFLRSWTVLSWRMPWCLSWAPQCAMLSYRSTGTFRKAGLSFRKNKNSLLHLLWWTLCLGLLPCCPAEIQCSSCLI